MEQVVKFTTPTVEKVIEFPDLNDLKDLAIAGFNKLVDEVDGWDKEDKKALAGGLTLISKDDEDMSDILRLIAVLVRKNSKSLETANLAEILQFIADVIDFSDETIGYGVEALVGFDE